MSLKSNNCKELIQGLPDDVYSLIQRKLAHKKREHDSLLLNSRLAVHEEIYTNLASRGMTSFFQARWLGGTVKLLPTP